MLQLVKVVQRNLRLVQLELFEVKNGNAGCLLALMLDTDVPQHIALVLLAQLVAKWFVAQDGLIQVVAAVESLVEHELDGHLHGVDLCVYVQEMAESEVLEAVLRRLVFG